MEFKQDCLHFNGYKPCSFKRPCENCPHYAKSTARVLVISLEAMGAVLRSTCLLPAIKREYPGAHVTWLTLPMSAPLLWENPLIDKLMALNYETLPILEHLEFDVLFCVDKSQTAGALAERIQAKKKLGFGMSPLGAIRPLNAEAQYQYEVGLDDHLKFKVNQKPETQQITETMALTWARDPYVLELTQDEKDWVEQKRAQILAETHSKGVIGFNTGCSILFPYKKFTTARAIETVALWRKEFPQYTVALLGGGEDDRKRQQEMKAHFPEDPFVVDTPCNEGLRKGILWMALSDAVFSGCSLGMHIAIGLQKKVVAWFGVSCIQEVDLYDRGIKIQADVPCSPCWKKRCDNSPKCFDKVEPTEIMEAFSFLLN